MAKETKDVSTSKVSLTNEQKEQARSALVSAGVVAPRLKKVRIPKRFEDISLRWVKQAPFFSEFMLRFHFFKTKDIPTAGVNVMRGNLNFYFNPEFIDGGGERPDIGDDGHPVIIKNKAGDPELDAQGNVQVKMVPREALTNSELEGLLIHEIYHIIRLHHERSLEDHQLFNVAADMLINDDISTLKINNRGMDLPAGGVFYKMAIDEGYTGEKVTEELYIWLQDVRQKYEDMMQKLIQQQMGGSGGEGSGSQGQQECSACGGDGQEKDENGNPTGETCEKCGGSGKESGQSGQGKKNSLFDVLFGSNIDVHEIMGQSDELSDATIQEVLDSAKIRGWGSMAGDAVSKIQELMTPAKIPWRQVLRKSLSPLIYDYGPHFENTWSRRNRRGLPLPGLRRLTNRLVIAIDTSGSIGGNELEQFFAQIEKIVKDFSQLIVIQWDTKIADVSLAYRKGDWKNIEVKGRGGTHVQCVFDWMSDNGYKKYPLINFTDGYFDYGFDNHGIKTIWCVTEADSTVPRGKNIFIDVN